MFIQTFKPETPSAPGTAATPAAIQFAAGSTPLTAATLGSAQIVEVLAGSPATVLIDVSLASSGRAFVLVPARTGGGPFTVVPSGFGVGNWLVEAGAPTYSGDSSDGSIGLACQADGVVRLVSARGLLNTVSRAVLGQANPANVAIIGNSIIAASASPRTIYTATTWQPATATTLNTVAGPKYWNLQAGISANKWVCTKAGNTGTLEPDWPHGAATGTTVTDGSVVWTYTALAGSLAVWAAWNFGYWHIAQSLSGQRLREVVIVGRSGAQSDEILSYVDRLIEDPNIGTIFLSNVFENDTWPGSAPVLSTIASRWNGYVAKADKVRAAGKRLMVSTLFPSGNIDSTSGFTGYAYGNGSKAWHWLNNKIREYARARGDVILFDAAVIYLDANPANPVYPENTVTYLSGAATGQALKKTDGIHTNTSANWLVGVELAKIITANFQPRTIFSSALDYKVNTLNPANYGTSGTRDATIGSGTVPNSMTMIAYSGTSGSCVASSVPRSDINGNWAQMVYVSAAGDNANLNWSTFQTPAFAAGDVVQAVGEIGVNANPTLLTSLQLQVRMLSATDPWVYSNTFSSTDQDLGQMITNDTVFTLKTVPFVWSAGVTTVGLYQKAFGRGAAAFTVRFGRTQLMPATFSASA